jgi:large subunit ribosomal protein L20
MTRVKRGNVARKRRKKILNLTKGFRGAASLLFRTANQRYMKAFRSAYENRHQKKMDFRSLWISRINAAIRFYGMNYSDFVHALKLCKIQLDRKMISQLSLFDTKTFFNLCENLIFILIKNKKLMLKA